MVMHVHYQKSNTHIYLPTYTHTMISCFVPCESHTHLVTEFITFNDSSLILITQWEFRSQLHAQQFSNAFLKQS